MVDAATEAASDLDCDVETTVEELFRGFRLRRTSPPVEIAMRALGPEPSRSPPAAAATPTR